jgi:hypothetical protein
MEVSGELHTLATLPQGKSPSYPLDRRLGRPQSQSGHSGEEKNFQPLPRLEPPIAQPIAQALYHWAFPVSRIFFFAPARESSVPIGREAGWAPSGSGHSGEEKKFPAPARNRKFRTNKVTFLLRTDECLGKWVSHCLCGVVMSNCSN